MKKLIIAVSVALSVAQAEQVCNDYLDRSTALKDFRFFAGGSHVTDKRTGLMWKRCLEGQTFDNNKTPKIFTDDNCSGIAKVFLRQEALYRVRKRDYRLPNIKELAAIAELQCVKPAVNTLIFPNQPNNWVLSATFVNLDNVGQQALSVNFETGVVGFGGKNSALRLVRYKNLLTS